MVDVDMEPEISLGQINTNRNKETFPCRIIWPIINDSDEAEEIYGSNVLKTTINIEELITTHGKVENLKQCGISDKITKNICKNY